MSTLTEIARTRPLVDGGSLFGRTILLAVNGDAPSASASRVALALERAWDTRAVAVCAYDPERAFALSLPIVGPPLSMTDALTERVRDGLGDVAREARDWPVLVVAGPPAQVIAEAAREVGAALVLMGLRARSPIQRAVRAETLMRVMRETSLPILATTAAMNRMPRRIMVALDFTRVSVRAARAALALLSPGGTLDLVYVDRESYPAPESQEGEDVIHRQGVAASFERLKLDLRAHSEVVITSTVLEGAPSQALREFAEQIEPDVIAIGARRHGMMDRMLLGSVTADLVHDGRWAMLVVPPRDR